MWLKDHMIHAIRWKLRNRIKVKLCSQYLPVLALNEVFIGEKDPHQLSVSHVIS